MRATTTRRGRLAAALLLAVLATGCATTVPGTPSAAPVPVAATSDGPARPTATRTPPLTRAPTAPTTPPVPQTSPDPGAASGPLAVKPVVPGWNVVRSTQRSALYDVPPTWNVQSEDTIIGFRDRNGDPLVSSGAAIFGRGVCGERTNLAISVVRHDEGVDLVAAARVNAQVWADAAYADDAGTPPALVTGEPETITTVAGQQASITKVGVTAATPSGQCAISRGSVYAVAATGFTGQLGPTVVLVVVADEGVAGAAPEAEIRRVLSTLRPVA